MSFFASIQHWFQSEFHGRHLGLILQELGKLQPSAFASYVSRVTDIPKSALKNARYEAEVSFLGKSQKRRADLAVFLEGQDDPAVLVEIKYYDDPRPGQFEDYRFWKGRQAGRQVIVLSRDGLEAPGLVLERWNHFARHLRPYAGKSELIHMLVEYLEQEGIVMQDLDGNSLTQYFKRLVCHDWQAGKSANNIEGPAQFTGLLQNLRLMSGSFEPKFKAAWRAAGLKVEGKEGRSQIATIDFRVFNTMKPLKRNTSYVSDELDLQNELKNGGQIEAFARHSLGHGNSDFLRIEYGMFFVIKPSNSRVKSPEVYLRASARGHRIRKADLEVYEVRKVPFSFVTDKAELSMTKVEAHLQALLRKTIAQLVEARLPLLPTQKKALSILLRSMSAPASEPAAVELARAAVRGAGAPAKSAAAKRTTKAAAKPQALPA